MEEKLCQEFFERLIVPLRTLFTQISILGRQSCFVKGSLHHYLKAVFIEPLGWVLVSTLESERVLDRTPGEGSWWSYYNTDRLSVERLIMGPW